MKKLISLFILMISIIPFTSGMFVTSVSAAEVVYSSDNLAAPDLTGKEYLGNGVYKLHGIRGITVNYNTVNGEYVFNGTTIGPTGVRITNNFTIDGGYTYTLRHIRGSKSSYFTTQFYSSPNDLLNLTVAGESEYSIHSNVDNRRGYINTYLGETGIVFDNYTFTLQLEKSDTATPYKVPSEPYNEHKRIQELYGVTEVTDQSKILLIAFIIYILTLFIAIYFKIRWLIGISALLWLVPITSLSNIYIIIISSVMIITQFIIAFYDKDKEEGFN